MPWRQESYLKHEDGTYEGKYREVENQIFENIKRHEPYLDFDYEELESCNFLNSDDGSENEEFSMLRYMLRNAKQHTTRKV